MFRYVMVLSPCFCRSDFEASRVYSKLFLRLIVDVPGEGNGVIGNLLDVADGVEAFFVVSYMRQPTRKRKL